MTAAHKPPVYDKIRWDNTIIQLRNDEKWEEIVLTATQELEKFDQTPDPSTGIKPKIKDAVFFIRPNIRQQIMYWKDRRNDCAHAKDNIINNYHVESFWSFLESNLAKITIQGGMNSLLNKLRVHYDITFTPPTQDVSPLVAEIPSAVEPTELTEFWVKSLAVIHSSRRRGVFIGKVFALQNQPVSESLMNFLKKPEHDSILLAYLSQNPSFIAQLSYTPTEVRKFWQTTIRGVDKPLAVYASMLANGLIPAAEIPDANNVLFKSIDRYEVDTVQHSLLQQNGFGDTVERLVFVPDNITYGIRSYIWTNDHASLIADFIKSYPLTNVVVEKLCAIYGSNTYSYFLRDRLQDLFTNDAAKKQEFKDVAAANGYTLPITHLPSLV